MFNDSVLAIFPGFALDVLAKATLLLVAVSLLDLSMSRSAAAMRHRVWVTAFMGLLLLPILSVLVPQYRLAVLPSEWISVAPEKPDDRVASYPIEERRESSHSSLSQSAVIGSQEAVRDLRQLSSQTLLLGVAEAEGVMRSSRTENLSLSAMETNSMQAVDAGWRLIGLIASLWGFGCLVATGPLMFGFVRIVLLQRRSPCISEPAARNILADLRRKLGIRRNVVLLETEHAIVPMTWGIRKPVVLLPTAWRDWEPERCRLVLLHELAHVKRIDVVYQSMARVACSLFWFHPLVWYALSRLRVERELACDDCVLMAGEKPSQYAQQLLSIAMEYQSMALPPAVAIVQRSGLEKRVRAILDKARSHLPLGPKVAGGMLLFSALFLAVLAPLRLGISPPASKANASENDITETNDVFQGKVVHPDGTPAAGASIHLVYFEQGRLPDNSIRPNAITDANGAFEIRGMPYENSASTKLVAAKVGFGVSLSKPAILFETTGKPASLPRATVDSSLDHPGRLAERFRCSRYSGQVKRKSCALRAGLRMLHR